MLRVTDVTPVSCPVEAPIDRISGEIGHLTEVMRAFYSLHEQGESKATCVALLNDAALTLDRMQRGVKVLADTFRTFMPKSERDLIHRFDSTKPAA